MSSQSGNVPSATKIASSNVSTAFCLPEYNPFFPKLRDVVHDHPEHSRMTYPLNVEHCFTFSPKIAQLLSAVVYPP